MKFSAKLVVLFSMLLIVSFVTKGTKADKEEGAEPQSNRMVGWRPPFGRLGFPRLWTAWFNTIEDCFPSKPGSCPISSSAVCDKTTNYCAIDCHCPGHQKCCPNSCGTMECFASDASPRSEPTPREADIRSRLFGHNSLTTVGSVTETAQEADALQSRYEPPEKQSDTETDAIAIHESTSDVGQELSMFARDAERSEEDVTNSVSRENPLHVKEVAVLGDASVIAEENVSDLGSATSEEETMPVIEEAALDSDTEKLKAINALIAKKEEELRLQQAAMSEKNLHPNQNLQQQVDEKISAPETMLAEAEKQGEPTTTKGKPSLMSSSSEGSISSSGTLQSKVLPEDANETLVEDDEINRSHLEATESPAKGTLPPDHSLSAILNDDEAAIVTEMSPQTTQTPTQPRDHFIQEMSRLRLQQQKQAWLAQQKQQQAVRDEISPSPPKSKSMRMAESMSRYYEQQRRALMNRSPVKFTTQTTSVPINMPLSD